MSASCAFAFVCIAWIATSRAQDAAVAVVGSQISIDDPGGHALDAFHRSLRSLPTATHPTRILLFGDSHTAGNVLPSTLRRTLAARFGDAGVGFVYPIRPWRYYQADGVNTARSSEWIAMRARMGDRGAMPLGLGGVAVEASIATAPVDFEISAASAIHRAELWAYAQEGAPSLEVGANGSTPVVINLASTTPTLSVTTFERPEAIARLSLRSVGEGPARIFGVVLENSMHGVVVDSLGINGARIADQLLWDEAVFREGVARRDPALLVFQYGTNESGDDVPLPRYESSMRTVLERAMRAAPSASCLLVGPTDRPVRVRRRHYEARGRTDDIRVIQRRVAAALGCGFFDTVTFQGGALATDVWAQLQPPFASSDRVHLTRIGYERWAIVLANALLEHATGLP